MKTYSTQKRHPRKNLYECQKECDNNPNCNNIRFCAISMGDSDTEYTTSCTLFDKVLTKFTEQLPNTGSQANCSTSFKTCPGGNKPYVEIFDITT